MSTQDADFERNVQVSENITAEIIDFFSEQPYQDAYIQKCILLKSIRVAKAVFENLKISSTSGVSPIPDCDECVFVIDLARLIHRSITKIKAVTQEQTQDCQVHDLITRTITELMSDSAPVFAGLRILEIVMTQKFKDAINIILGLQQSHQQTLKTEQVLLASVVGVVLVKWLIRGTEIAGSEQLINLTVVGILINASIQGALEEWYRDALIDRTRPIRHQPISIQIAEVLYGIFLTTVMGSQKNEHEDQNKSTPDQKQHIEHKSKKCQCPKCVSQRLEQI